MTQDLPKILIVDDKPENLLALERVLNGLDVVIIRADSGEQALACMLREQFVVVLLDVNMPGMSGIETATLMRGHAKTIQTPVIFVTGYDADELDQLEGYAAGAADYIVKPINPEILLSKVRIFLRLFLQSTELKHNYEETAALEKTLKHKNLELKITNNTLEQINIERIREHKQTRRLLEVNTDGILVVDRSNVILYTNPEAAVLIDREAKQLIGETFDFPIANGENSEITLGRVNIVEMSIASVDWDGESAYLVTLHNINERKKIEAQLIRLAQRDELTGLANRRHCLEHMGKALARARRNNRNLAVLFLDLNKFKDINDTLGHDLGDELLRSVAERIRSCLRKSDLAARFGGDEFALVLDEISQPEDAGIIAQKIIQAIAQPHHLVGQQIVIGCSIGIATFPLCGEDPKALLKAADIAMFNAKSRGRNKYQFFAEAMQQELLERTQLELDLRQALQRNEFELHYQPQVDANSGTIVALEALIRWHHATRGMIPPGQFIPVAESTGLIVEIGDWVMRTACRQAHTWQSTFHGAGRSTPLTVAINVSLAQLSNGDFRDRVDQVLRDTGVDPQYLEFELTESLMMDDPGATAIELATIHDQGIGIAMDDFGTGYSSLAHLQRLSLNTLKIDLSFVSRIGVDPHSEVLIKTIIAMAHSLDLRVVAEGVETEQQAAFLRRNGCDLLQGFYFSRPLPCDEATQLLKKGLTTLGDDYQPSAVGF